MTREEKMNKRKASGKTYTYKPNPFEEGTQEYYEEKFNRMRKNRSHKTEVAQWDSIMDKLNNRVAKEKMDNKMKKMKSE